MSVARHHADWLNLVEASGPFVSLPVSIRVFPQGLDQLDAGQARELRLAYGEWRESPNGPGRQDAWVRHALQNLLGWPSEALKEGQSLPPGLEATLAEYAESLRPEFALVAPEGHPTAGKVQLLVQIYPTEQALDRFVPFRHWKASPLTRMTELLHAADVPLGLVTNGEQWTLVFAPRGETSGFASWYAALWGEEPITLRAFQSLLGLRRFFGVAETDTLLNLLTASARDQQEVTDQLGYQVREAVEVLVQSLDKLDQESKRTVLRGISEEEIYQAALTVMMRLVFLFSAEERKLLHLGEPIYDDNYAVSTLRDQLQEIADHHGEEILERRCDAWARLLATFRALHGGISHEDLSLPAYGGSLFDPDRFPFLEGRSAGSHWRDTPADPLAIHNRVVLHLLRSLQMLRVKVPGGGPAAARRLSFLALGIEQIGHVYEGLLDHAATRAQEPILGLKGTLDQEPEIPLSRLEQSRVAGEEALLTLLREETGRSLPTLRKALISPELADESKLLFACGQDRALLERIRPFASLVRDDSFDRPIVILPGSVYITAGTTRRRTGTHYTPVSLTEPIVRYALEPLVYEGQAGGLPKEQWKLRSPEAILALRVCDMAMGSGAFLVQACRYLAERLVEAWEKNEAHRPADVLVAPQGASSAALPSERILPKDPDERLAVARRAVTDHCLFGVDINPMAVEMAKLSLWLVTLQKDRPFTFLDHALRCGDSLLGITTFQQLQRFGLRSESVEQIAFDTLAFQTRIETARRIRDCLEDLPSETSTQIQSKSKLHQEAESAVRALRAAADALLVLELGDLSGDAYVNARASAIARLVTHWSDEPVASQGPADQNLSGQRPMHWPLAFPEVIGRGGFDAIIGNPPFMKGHFISQRFGHAYRAYLERIVAGDNAGLADFVAFFFRKALSLLRAPGHMGLLATNSIADGDTNRVGLQGIASSGFAITRAQRDITWPGSAGVVVTAVHIFHGAWTAAAILDDQAVKVISERLSDLPSYEIRTLGANIGMAYVGSYPLGDGFVISEEQARSWLEDSDSNAQVLRPYISGKELYSFPDLRPRRWIITFWDWPEERAKAYRAPYAHVASTVQPVRREVNRARRRDLWWLFAETQVGLYRAIGHDAMFSVARDCSGARPQSGTVLAKAKTSNTWAFASLPGDIIFDQSLVVIVRSNADTFSVVQSAFHEIWADHWSSTLKTDMSYTPSSVFATFPFPKSDMVVSECGRRYSEWRQQVMMEQRVGLTTLSRRVHDAKEQSADIVALRVLETEMNQAIARAYGWCDLSMERSFCETKRGMRLSVPELVKMEILGRLVRLNQERYEEDVTGGRENMVGRNRVRRGGSEEPSLGI